MSIYTVNLILEKMRLQSNQNPNIQSMPSDIEASYIDEAQDLIYKKIMKIRPDILSTYFDLSLTGSERYFIPDYFKYNYDEIIYMEDVTGTDAVPTSPTKWKDRGNYYWNKILCQYEPWSIRDQYIEFPLKPTNITMRIWISRSPVGLLYGTAAGGSNTTIIFPTTPDMGSRILIDDYYNGMKVYCGGEIKIITDYVSSTKTATVNSTWIATPTGASAMSLISNLPDSLHSLIPDVAAMLIRGKAYDDQIDTISALIEKTIEENFSGLIRPQRQSSETVRKIPRN